MTEVDYIGLDFIKKLSKFPADQFVSIRIYKRLQIPKRVIDPADRNAVVLPPFNLIFGAARIRNPVKHADLVVVQEFPGELKGVDFGTRHILRRKSVDDLNDLHRASNRINGLFS